MVVFLFGVTCSWLGVRQWVENLVKKGTHEYWMVHGKLFMMTGQFFPSNRLQRTANRGVILNCGPKRHFRGLGFSMASLEFEDNTYRGPCQHS